MTQSSNGNISLLDGLHSTPARRYLSDTEIPDEIIWKILDAAIRGPSGGNNQGWGWIVVRNQETKDKISEWYLEGWDRAYGTRRNEILERSDENDTLGPRNYLSAEHLANNISKAPVWIIAVLRNAANATNARTGSSIYGAVQHLMLAARAYGIGATLTTLYSGHEDDVKKLLNIPDDALTMALIPLGYPSKGRWSQPKRESVENITHWDKWNVKKDRAPGSEI